MCLIGSEIIVCVGRLFGLLAPMCRRPVGVVNFRKALGDWPLGGRCARRGVAAAAAVAVNGGGGAVAALAARPVPVRSVPQRVLCWCSSVPRPPVCRSVGVGAPR